MIDFDKELVSALETILPTYHELVLHSGIDTPCISYQETNNYAEDEGNTIGYSRIVYTIKVWGNRVADMKPYILAIDAALRPLGFKRTSTGELYTDMMIQKILTYEVRAIEDF